MDRNPDDFSIFDTQTQDFFGCECKGNKRTFWKFSLLDSPVKIDLVDH